MRVTQMILAVGLSLFCRCHGFAQGFVNLNFNMAQLSGYSAGYIPATNAVPGWTAYIDNTPQTSILYDTFSGSGCVALYDTNALYGGGVIPGNQYTIFLAGGGSDGSMSASIAQTAIIPANAQTVTFEASVLYPNYTTGWQISVNGQIVPATPVAEINGVYYEYAANVSAFAGQLDTLEFTALAGASGLQPGSTSLADIAFSSNPIPEPSELALAVAGAGLFGFCRWQRIKK